MNLSDKIREIRDAQNVADYDKIADELTAWFLEQPKEETTPVLRSMLRSRIQTVLSLAAVPGTKWTDKGPNVPVSSPPKLSDIFTPPKPKTIYTDTGDYVSPKTARASIYGSVLQIGSDTKFFADCTSADFRVAAQQRIANGKSQIAVGESYNFLAARMDDNGWAVGADIPEAELTTVVG